MATGNRTDIESGAVEAPRIARPRVDIERGVGIAAALLGPVGVLICVFAAARAVGDLRRAGRTLGDAFAL